MLIAQRLETTGFLLSTQHFAITDKNPEAVILFVIANSAFEWVVSAEMIAEYKEVLKRPRLKLTEAQYQR